MDNVVLLLVWWWMTSQAEWFANHGESLKGGSGQAPPTAHLVDICQSFLSQETRIYKCAQCDLLIYVCSIRLANVHICWTFRHSETDWWERRTDGKFQVSADDSSCYWRPAWPTSISTFQEKKIHGVLTSKVVVRERQRLRDGIWSFFLLSHRWYL